MDIKYILKGIWKKSPINFMIGLWNIITLFFLSKIRFGRRVPIKDNSKPWQPSIEQFKEIETAALTILFANNGLPDQLKPVIYNKYKIRKHEFRHVGLSTFESDEMIVAIRGSQNEQNWIDNFSGDLVKDSILGITVHRGYRFIAREIVEGLTPFLDKKKPLRIVGGSLGGAVAILVGWYFTKMGYSVVQLLNIAGPKLTDEDYSHLPVTTITHECDPVPYLPLATPIHRYRHQGKRILIDKHGKFWEYPDNTRTDFLLSAWGIDHALHWDYHMRYGEYLQNFKG